jgi:hypothetical protein
MEVDAAITDIAEGLRPTVIVNRVAREFYPPLRLMDHRLRRRLASGGTTRDEFADAILGRLPTASSIQEDVRACWERVSAEVADYDAAQLRDAAPGEEILNALFQEFIGRGYKKKTDGVTIARAMATPPVDLMKVVRRFLAG